MIFHMEFWIFATVLIFLPHINCYESFDSYYGSFYTPTTLYSQHRRYWQQPRHLSDYQQYFSYNDPSTLTTEPEAKTNQDFQSDDDDTFDSYPGQGYMNYNLNRARQAKQSQVQEDSDTENVAPVHEGTAIRRNFSPQQQGSYPQVNYDYKPSQYQTHHTLAQNPVQQNTYYNSYPNRVHSIYPIYNRDNFQPSGTNQKLVTSTPTNVRGQNGLAFKVQRDPEGKLNVVFNDTINIPHNSEDYLLPTNPSRRSTHKVSTTRPTQPTRRQQGEGGGGDIVFPDDLGRNRLIKPQCSKNDGYFCSEVQNYPAAHVQATIRAELDKFENFFGDDLVEAVIPNVTQRIDAPGEESLCQSAEKVIYPQAGLTKDNNWSFIVNQDNFTQGIRIEECVNPGKPCSMSDLFPNGYTTECRQSYIYRQLLSVNPEGKVIKDLFRLPSCCKCIIKSSHRFRRATTTYHAKN